MFSLICTCIYGWVNNRKDGDLERHRAHYDVTVMDGDGGSGSSIGSSNSSSSSGGGGGCIITY